MSRVQYFPRKSAGLSNAFDFPLIVNWNRLGVLILLLTFRFTFRISGVVRLVNSERNFFLRSLLVRTQRSGVDIPVINRPIY